VKGRDKKARAGSRREGQGCEESVVRGSRELWRRAEYGSSRWLPAQHSTEEQHSILIL
jgi:hypothetical protein